MIELLTKRTQELIDVTSLETALKLVERFGGTTIWVPKNPKPEHALAQLIGLPDFKKLCHYYGDTAVEIDRCVAVILALRDEQIRKDSEDLTDRQLARKHHLTERQIRRIRVKRGVPLHKDKHNLDLFDFLLES